MSENTKSRPGEFDALEKARPDEMIFTLLERDPCAPATIDFWCGLRRERARSIKDDDARANELRQITEAEFIGFSMADRQRGHRSVDAEAKPAPTYSGLKVDATEIDKLMPKLRAELAEADYHAANARELAKKIRQLEGVDNHTLMRIDLVAQSAHEMALQLSPHRAAYMAEGELPLEGEE